MIDCYTGMGTAGRETITEIKTKYDEDTGAPYEVVVCGDHEYRADNGQCIKGPKMYYMVVR